MLEYCLELSWALDCDEFFEKQIAYHVSFDKNIIFKNRANYSLEELQQALIEEGYGA